MVTYNRGARFSRWVLFLCYLLALSRDLKDLPYYTTLNTTFSVTYYLEFHVAVRFTIDALFFTK